MTSTTTNQKVLAKERSISISSSRSLDEETSSAGMQLASNTGNADADKKALRPHGLKAFSHLSQGRITLHDLPLDQLQSKIAGIDEVIRAVRAAVPDTQAGYNSIFEILDKLIPKDLAIEIIQRDKVKTVLVAAFRSVPTLQNLKRASHIHGCQSNFLTATRWTAYDDLKATLIPYACHQRACPTCSRQISLARFNRVVKHFASKPPNQQNFRWITFTVRNCKTGSLAGYLKNLLKAWRQFRRLSRIWNEHVSGYIYNLEITFNSRLSTWHPHIHAVYDGSFMPWAELKDQWISFCRRRQFEAADIKIGRAYKLWQDGHGKKHRLKIETNEQAIQALLEVTKYTLKPFELARIPAAVIIELADATKNLRSWGTAGTLQVPAEPKHPATWDVLGGLHSIIMDEKSPYHSEPEFQKALNAALFCDKSRIVELIRSFPLLADIFSSEVNSAIAAKDQALRLEAQEG